MFTVVIPTHRRPELLAFALESVARQTLRGSQVVVVDDVGDEDTRAVAASFPGVEYMVNTNAKGGSGARNTGIAAARGRWIAFLDDDDLWLPHKLEAVAGCIDRGSSDLGLVYSAAEHFDTSRRKPLMRTEPRVRGWVLDEVLYRNAIGGMSVVVARRDLLEQIGGFDERFPAMQDFELFVRLAQVATFDYVDDVLVRERAALHARITLDPDKKLAAARLFAQKYAHLMARRPRLRHRTAARTFVLALAAGKVAVALRQLPWTLAGPLVDPKNVPYVVRGVASSAREGQAALRVRLHAGAAPQRLATRDGSGGTGRQSGADLGQ